MDADRDDRHDLRRFVDAQAGAYAQAREELAAARKRSHWMWFVFPQMRGLGASAMAHRYGIASRAEAVAYLDHALLGPRLVDCTRLVLAAPPGTTATAILGSPDDVKLRSSMTLFDAVAADSARFAGALRTSTPFAAALDRFFAGRADPATLRLLADR
jgi:uncharacterized protein (DUF1810 family)